MWHEEDVVLKERGFNSSVPNFENIENKIFERYEKCGINYIETRFSNGNDLFKQLKYFRSNSTDLNDVIKLIST